MYTAGKTEVPLIARHILMKHKSNPHFLLKYRNLASTSGWNWNAPRNASEAVKKLKEKDVDID